MSEGTRIEIDLTSVGVIPDGDYTATIQSAEIKTSEAGNTYIKWRVMVPSHGNIFHNTTLKEGALFGIKTLLDAAGVKCTKEGFDYNEAVGKQIGIKIATKEDPTYGAQANIVKVWKV